MVMASSREGYEAKQEGDKTTDAKKFSKAPFSSRQWSLGSRNPRIVRVSRLFGGKDRHSKVCTIRGLRDRRIRLSIPTAIQLYDLQDKLGLSQPSKVIDWLLEATKYDIDKLPPLQFPQGFYQFHHQQTLIPPPHHHENSGASHQFSLGSFYDANYNQNLMTKPSRYNWDIDGLSSRLKGKEVERGGYSLFKTNEEENQEIGVQRLFPIGTSHHSSLNLPGSLNNNATMSYNNLSEPSNISLLSQFGSHGILFPSSQLQLDPNGVQFPSCSGSQLLFCPPSAVSTPSLFTTPYAPPFMTPNSSVESDQYPSPRPFNHVQFLSSSSHVLPHHPLIPSFHSINSPLRPLPTPFSSKLLDSDIINDRSQQGKGT